LRTLDNPYCMAITHLRLGVLAAHQSDSGGAVENLTLADRLLADIHGAMTPYHRSVHARTLAAVNGTLTRG
jgi:hypothetical protein